MRTIERERKNTLSVYRRELKYMIDLPDRLYLLQALDKVLMPDAYGGYNGYRVRSVYFDGQDNQDYHEKMEKREFVKRMRLRIYNAADQTAKFEIKKKRHGNQVKESVLIAREDAQEILGGNFGVLMKYDSDTARYGYEIGSTMGYRPVSMVEYQRRAYTHPCFNTRITLDNELRYCNFDYDMYSESPNYKAVLPITKTILEVKYERFLFDQIQHVLKKCNLQRCPVSKFGSSRELLQEYYY